MAPFASARSCSRASLSLDPQRCDGENHWRQAPGLAAEVECQLARARQPSLGIVLRRIVGSWLISAALKGRESIPGR
jgi:hypothetical protein